MGFSWSGIKPVSLALAGSFFTTEPPGTPSVNIIDFEELVTVYSFIQQSCIVQDSVPWSVWGARDIEVDKQYSEPLNHTETGLPALCTVEDPCISYSWPSTLRFCTLGFNQPWIMWHFSIYYQEKKSAFKWTHMAQTVFSRINSTDSFGTPVWYTGVRVAIANLNRFVCPQAL